jgi:hypothetical protein
MRDWPDCRDRVCVPVVRRKQCVEPQMVAIRVPSSGCLSSSIHCSSGDWKAMGSAPRDPNTGSHAFEGEWNRADPSARVVRYPFPSVVFSLDPHAVGGLTWLNACTNGR